MKKRKERKTPKMQSKELVDTRKKKREKTPENAR